MDERNGLALTAGIGIGIALGAGIGAAMNNIALGIAIDAGLGATFVARNDEDGRG
jgi:hypothetical protein